MVWTDTHGLEGHSRSFLSPFQYRFEVDEGKIRSIRGENPVSSQAGRKMEGGGKSEGGREKGRERRGTSVWGAWVGCGSCVERFGTGVEVRTEPALERAVS